MILQRDEIFQFISDTYYLYDFPESFNLSVPDFPHLYVMQEVKPWDLDCTFREAEKYTRRTGWTKRCLYYSQGAGWQAGLPPPVSETCFKGSQVKEAHPLPVTLNYITST